MFDADLMPIFLEESRENLQSMEEALLELEKTPENSELLNVVFRAIHTIKGGAGLMGLELISSLAHDLENILDEIRQTGKELPAEVLDLFFTGIDLFRQIFASGVLHGEGFKAQAEELFKALELYTEGEEGEDNHYSSENKIFSMEFSALPHLQNEILEEAVDGEERLCRVNVHLYPDCLLKSVRAYMVLKAVEGQARIIKVEPSLKDLEEENFEASFSLIIISQVDPEEIQNAVENISEVEKVKIFVFNEDVEEVLQEQRRAGGLLMEEDKMTGVTGVTVEEIVQTQERFYKQEKIDTIRVETDKLENMLNNIAELLIAQSRVKELFFRFAGKAGKQETEVSNAFQETDKIIRGLQEEVMKVSMVPVSSIFVRFRRMIRDLARERGKEVELVIEGEETELDKKVIEQIADPLKHLLRNAVDHGLESPEERVAQGKPATGIIKLEALHQEGNVVIKISDDGRGIDAETILKKAREKGFVDSEQELSATDLHRLLFKPGFSTAHEISDLSGRGVGLDVVQHNIQNLHGGIEVFTEKGQGTCFCIKLPLTQAIIDGMMVRVGTEHFILPLVSIKEFIKAQPGDVRQVEGKGAVLSLRQEFIPYAGLYQFLQLQPEFENPIAGILVILQEGRKKLALLVDDIIGQEQVVIKNIAENMEQIDGIAGATILGNGQVAMILDVAFLFRRKSKLETNCQVLGTSTGNRMSEYEERREA
ncbi:MAG: chemotaxis protein CheA [Dethiobacteria bacterium]|jgi:two-component system chemotaxis sensor kinase CheA